MKSSVIIFFIALITQNISIAQNELSDCELCIPESLYNEGLTKSQFDIEVVNPDLSSFTYKLRFSPNSTFAAQNSAWNNWVNFPIQSSLGANGTCQIVVVHQFILYEQNGSTETFIEQFWSSPNYSNIDGFNSILELNKEYKIKHGIYYGSTCDKDDSRTDRLYELCPWKESLVFTERTVGTKKRNRLPVQLR